MGNSPDIDHGWAYVVMLGYFITRFLVLGMSLSPGILYNDLLDYFENSPALTAWAIAVNSFLLYTCGSIASAFIKAYGSRVTVIIGSVFSTAGLIAASFASSLLDILIFYGIMTGFGYSLVNVSCYPVVTEYFDKYRGMVLLLASSGEGFGQFTLPYLFLWLSNSYTWKGALMIMAGLNLNFLVIAASFMPPRREAEETEEDYKADSSKPYQSSKMPARHSIANGALTCLKTLVDDLVLFKDYCFVLVCFSYLFLALGFLGTMTQVRAYGLQSGLTEVEATTLLSFLGLFSLAGTALMTFLLQVFRMNVLILNVIFNVGMGASIIILGVVKTKVGYFIVSAIVGVFAGCVAAFPLVVLTVVGIENVAPGIGYASISCGIGCVTGGPIGAALYTADPSYIATFGGMGVACIIGGLLEIPIIFVKKQL